MTVEGGIGANFTRQQLGDGDERDDEGRHRVISARAAFCLAVVAYAHPHRAALAHFWVGTAVEALAVDPQ